MAATTTTIPEHLGRFREALPNLRGEDEAEILYLANLIETLSWILFPSRHPTCILGRHPKPPNDSHAFCASLYSMGKDGAKYLVLGPEMGISRKKVLMKLLVIVEREIGRMMFRDAKRANAGEAGEG
ncbi:hypothetical protein BKA66DRAFT_569331 [Pyrenochaeta sp. MPI-SDFR-AT-0127]|nr:hypothetical protein BKA66DRAFT_569331 [Pyrenochaeta sp. MPI-SDFR-AT-0127]